MMRLGGNWETLFVERNRILSPDQPDAATQTLITGLSQISAFLFDSSSQVVMHKVFTQSHFSLLVNELRDVQQNRSSVVQFIQHTLILLCLISETQVEISYVRLLCKQILIDSQSCLTSPCVFISQPWHTSWIHVSFGLSAKAAVCLSLDQGCKPRTNVQLLWRADTYFLPVLKCKTPSIQHQNKHLEASVCLLYQRAAVWTWQFYT